MIKFHDSVDVIEESDGIKTQFLCPLRHVTFLFYFLFFSLLNQMFPMLSPRITWHYASETDGACDDCCLDSNLFYVECGKATFDFLNVF